MQTVIPVAIPSGSYSEFAPDDQPAVALLIAGTRMPAHHRPRPRTGFATTGSISLSMPPPRGIDRRMRRLRLPRVFPTDPSWLLNVRCLNGRLETCSVLRVPLANNPLLIVSVVSTHLLKLTCSPFCDCVIYCQW
jgi:hypothetical protein